MFYNLKNNVKFWRYITNFWAIIIYIVIIFDFIKNNALGEILSPLAAIYIAVLAMYAGDKEFERWHHSRQKRHPGEVFVIIWTALVFGIIALDFIFSKPYKIPGEIISVYIAVLGILAITRKSKSLYWEQNLEIKEK